MQGPAWARASSHRCPASLSGGRLASQRLLARHAPAALLSGERCPRERPRPPTWLRIFSISSSRTFSIFQSPLICAMSNRKCLRVRGSNKAVASAGSTCGARGRSSANRSVCRQQDGSSSHSLGGLNTNAWLPACPCASSASLLTPMRHPNRVPPSQRPPAQPHLMVSAPRSECTTSGWYCSPKILRSGFSIPTIAPCGRERAHVQRRAWAANRGAVPMLCLHSCTPPPRNTTACMQQCVTEEKRTNSCHAQAQAL